MKKERREIDPLPRAVRVGYRALQQASARLDCGELPVFLASVLGSFVDTLAKEEWEHVAAVRFDPCGKPGCRCHEVKGRLQALLGELRAEGQKSRLEKLN